MTTEIGIKTQRIDSSPALHPRRDVLQGLPPPSYPNVSTPSSPCKNPTPIVAAATTPMSPTAIPSPCAPPSPLRASLSALGLDVYSVLGSTANMLACTCVCVRACVRE